MHVAGELLRVRGLSKSFGATQALAGVALDVQAGEVHAATFAVGQLSQESNTFNPLLTTRADYEQFGVVRGTELVEQMAATTELGGFITALRAWPARHS